MDLTIKPHWGLGQLRLGMSRDQVAALLGKPDEIEDRRGEPPDDEVWHYEKLGIRAFFDADDGDRMGFIITDNMEASVFGVSGLMGQSYGQVLKRLPKEKLGDFSVDDYGEGLSWEITFDHVGLTFNFDYGDGPFSSENPLQFISISVQFDDAGDHILWPE